MDFNRHLNLVGLHAELSASKYHWLKYDDDKFDRVFMAGLEAKRGTELHTFAAMAIRLGQKMPTNRTTVNMYINDAIGYRMTPEQPLLVTENCFGTPDAISFRNNKLRIHDLKTGKTQTKMEQLMVYMAMFCMEYRFEPFKIESELRIYQNDEIRVFEPDPDDIVHIIEKIKYLDKRIRYLKEEVQA